jgi:hypothetical protein
VVDQTAVKSILLAAPRRRILLAVIALSIALRLFFAADIVRCPFSRLHEWGESDMAFFHSWAIHIAGGDWLSDAPLHPNHLWHKVITKAYFDLYPLEREQYANAPDPGIALWNAWYNGKCFHQEPLYVYCVAFLYKLFGPEVRVVFVLQLLLGVLINVVIVRWTMRHYGPIAGATAGFLAVFYAPLLFHEGLLLRETLVVWFNLVLLSLGGLCVGRGTRRNWFVFGCVLGLALLAKLTFALVGLLAIFGIARPRRLPPRERITRIGLFAGGVALLLIPAVVRNLAVGCPPFALAANGPITFVHGNLHGSMPELGVYLDPKQTAVILHETHGRLLGTVLETVKTHPSVFDYLGLLVQKLGVTFGSHELPDNASLNYLTHYSTGLRIAFLGFAPLAGLALTGIGVSCLKLRRSWLLILFVLANLLPILGFYSTSRYRLPFASLLFPFAGLTVSRLVAAYRSWDTRSLLFTSTAVLVTLAFVARPIPDRVPIERLVDAKVVFSLCDAPGIQRAQAAGRWDTAAELLGAFLDRPTGVITCLEKGKAPVRSADRELVHWYAELFKAQADAWERGGEHSLAQRARERSQTLLQR